MTSGTQRTQELLRTIEFDTHYRRMAALIELGKSEANLDDVIRPLLYLISEDSEDGNIKLWAAAALVRLGLKAELIRDTCLLMYLDYVVEHPYEMSPVGLLESEVIYVLGLFNNDSTASEHLMTAVRNVESFGSSSVDLAEVRTYRISSFINDCLQSLAAINHENAKGFLEYWSANTISTDDTTAVFNIKLKTIGPNKISVIKAVREITSMGLREAKELVESAPISVKSGVWKAEANEIQAKLAEAGAIVEVIGEADSIKDRNRSSLEINREPWSENKNYIDVKLKTIGPNKISVIKAVREITSMGLREAKELVESAPIVIKNRVSMDEAIEIKDKLEEAGAVVELS